MGEETADLGAIKAALRAFSDARDWDQFHTPKNLAMALSVEAAELLELYQWLTPEESVALTANADGRARVEHELADILIYLARLADVTGIDLGSAVAGKMQSNSTRFPVTGGSA